MGQEKAQDQANGVGEQIDRRRIPPGNEPLVPLVQGAVEEAQAEEEPGRAPPASPPPPGQSRAEDEIEPQVGHLVVHEEPAGFGIRLYLAQQKKDRRPDRSGSPGLEDENQRLPQESYFSSLLAASRSLPPGEEPFPEPGTGPGAPSGTPQKAGTGAPGKRLRSDPAVAPLT